MAACANQVTLVTVPLCLSVLRYLFKLYVYVGLHGTLYNIFYVCWSSRKIVYYSFMSICSIISLCMGGEEGATVPLMYIYCKRTLDILFTYYSNIFCLLKFILRHGHAGSAALFLYNMHVCDHQSYNPYCPKH